VEAFEFKLEEDKLKEITEIIKEELLEYAKQRKDMTDFIIDYRKGVLEEYRDDEDRLMEYFDHEIFVKEEAFRNIDNRLKELVILAPSPYFGRIDFLDSEFQALEKLYIGRFGIIPRGSYEPIVVDWRAPVASIFYEGSMGEDSYNAPTGKVKVDVKLKRQYIIKKAKLKGMFDSALDVKDEILQLTLSKNAGDKLKDIIMTIQKEQDNIIRKPYNKTVLVNGIAGSGKTTIALHRVAYLLYNYRDTLGDKVLILGPNSIFMEYIGTVLPSLGEVGVKQLTFNEFAYNIIAGEALMTEEGKLYEKKKLLKSKDIKTKGISFEELDYLLNCMSYKEYMEKVLSEDKAFLGIVKYKNSLEFIESLDKEIKCYNGDYVGVEPLVYKGKVVLTVEEIRGLLADYMNLPLLRRLRKVRSIIYLKLNNERDDQIRDINDNFKASISKLSEEEKNDEESNLLYFRRAKIREVIRELILSRKSLEWMAIPSSIQIYKKYNKGEQLTIDDLAPILYIKVKLEGARLKNEIKHIVIDEFQDYSILQLKVIEDITKCKFFTLVGDRNQRLLPENEDSLGINEGDRLRLGIEEFNLYKSYRSTAEIMQYASKFLKDKEEVAKQDYMVRQGDIVTEESFDSFSLMADAISETIARLEDAKVKSEDAYENIAVICKNDLELERIRASMNSNTRIKVINREDINYTGGVVILPSYFSKGMEFDVVIMALEDKEKGDKLKYIMATRALHKLYVYSYKQDK